MIKKCFKCNKEKDVSQFYKHGQMKDGYLNKCKECTKQDVREHRKINHKYYKDYDKKRNMLPHRVSARKEYINTRQGREVKNKASRKYYYNNKEYYMDRQRREREEQPEKYIARQKLLYAVQSGKIERPNKCKNCHAECVPHGHHSDYSKPLDVDWLCPRCHGLEHSNESTLTL